jgi:hypothetical protein
LACLSKKKVKFTLKKEKIPKNSQLFCSKNNKICQEPKHGETRSFLQVCDKAKENKAIILFYFKKQVPHCKMAWRFK